MKIDVQLCGLAINLVLLYFIIKHESVGLFSEKVFKLCIAVYTSCVVLDILSIVVIAYDTKYPDMVVMAVCKLYLCLIVTTGFCGFFYTYSDILHLRENDMMKKGLLGFLAFGCFCIIALPVKYHHEGSTIYTYGAGVIATYIFAAIFIVCTIICTYKYAKHMSLHRRRAIRAWMYIEIVAAVIQFFNPEQLIVGFASSLGLFILYSELENPEVYHDRLAGCFSRDTFSMYIKQVYADIRKFSSIIVCNSDEWKMEEEQARRILVSMAEFLGSFGEAKLFRLDANDFVLIYDKKEQEMNEIESAVNLDIIRQRFSKGWGTDEPVITKFLYIPNNSTVSSQEEYIALYQRYRDSFEADEISKTLDETAGERIREFNQMKQEIKNALKEERIEVFYQPIYSIETEKFVSAEALARMRGKDGKLVMPGKFIPVAEETGLISAIGERVFEMTCKCIKERNLVEMGVHYVEVNLSVAQCENPELSAIYDEIMKKIDLKPEYINLEITESSTLSQRSILLDNMNKLMNIGCSFSLDDFGTGESNLNYIVDMPVKIVKFDRSMIQDYFSNDRAKVVMKATVGMIKDLGLKIVAEGVETEEQVEGIRALGIDYIQGFYFSKPLSTNDFVKFIETKNAS